MEVITKTRSAISQMIDIEIDIELDYDSCCAI